MIAFIPPVYTIAISALRSIHRNAGFGVLPFPVLTIPPFPLILLFPFSLSLSFSFSFPFLPDSESLAIQLEHGARVQVDRCRNFHRFERDGERTRKRVKKREWVYKTDTTFIWQNVCRTYRLAIREFLKFCRDFRTSFLDNQSLILDKHMTNNTHNIP